jgi:hypothetical protein
MKKFTKLLNIYLNYIYLEDSAVPFFGTGIVVSDVTFTQLGNGIKVFLFEDKVLEVFGDTARSDTLGNNRDTSLGSKCNTDLCGRLVQLFGNRFDNRVINNTVLTIDVVTERRVSCDGDFILLTELNQFGLLEGRVELNLEHRRTDTAVIQDVLNLLDVEVGET